MSGQAASLNSEDWTRLERVCNSDTHRLIWALLRYTGARINEVLTLTVEDVYSQGKPRESILYKKENRKGKDKNHAVFVCSALSFYLKSYQPPANGYLFPSSRGRSGHISYEAVREYLTKCSIKAGLGYKAVRTHSGRRSLITSLISKGTNLRTVMSISGHADIRNVIRYADANPNQTRLALEGAFS